MRNPVFQRAGNDSRQIRFQVGHVIDITTPAASGLRTGAFRPRKGWDGLPVKSMRRYHTGGQASDPQPNQKDAAK